MRSTRAVSGWSSRGDQTRHPHVLDRSPLGSSAGSAVAVPANLCLASLGAEVDGSISRQASSNGNLPIEVVLQNDCVVASGPDPMGRCKAHWQPECQRGPDRVRGRVGS